MAYTEDLSDYSEDFEDEDSSKDLPKHPEVVNTPKRAHLSHHTRTDPGQRKTRSNYHPSVSKVKHWSVGKGRAVSEKPLKRGTPLAFSPRDRELSAKVHSIKRLENQLADCRRELGEVKRENKLLTRLQIRQERELTRVQTQEGELPQILARHSEEVRALKEQLKRSNEASHVHEDKSRSLRDEIQKLLNRSKKLEQAAKHKNLLDRESLTLQLQEANERIQEKDRKLKELEKGKEMLNKAHGQEVKALLVKNKTLTQDLETAKEKTQKMHALLKERMKEMDVMNIYSQRMGRNTLNTSTPLQIDTSLNMTEEAYAQTDMTCSPDKNVSMQNKRTLKSSSAQTQCVLNQTRTTQTEIAPVEKTTTPSPPPTNTSLAHTTQQKPTQSTQSSQHKQEEVVSPPAQPTQQLIRSPPLPEPPAPQVTDKEQQHKNLLLSRLKALDSQKGPPASHTLVTAPVKTATEAQSSLPTAVASRTTEKRAITSPPTTQTTSQLEETKKKKLLLAKLMAIDKKAEPQKLVESKPNVTSNPTPPQHLSEHSGSSLQSWQADTVTNMHKGKPAFFTEDDPFGSRSSPRKRSGGTVKGMSVMKTSATNDNTTTLSTQGYKPTFGRRARGTDAGLSNSSINEGAKNTFSKSTFSVSGGTQNKSSIFNSGLDSNNQASKEPLGLLDREVSGKQPVGREYPWEKRVNLHDNALQGPGNQSMVFGPMTKAPLLPLRPKAEANRVDVLPGGLAEPDDMEELVL